MDPAPQAASKNLRNFNRACLLHSAMAVDFAAEAADMARSSRRLSHAEYLSHGLSHRFCLVAPGDFVSTHKITEAMAVGGAGGCIPVFVMPSKGLGRGGPQTLTTDGQIDLSSAVQKMLPYSRWLDYCKVAYLLLEHEVTANVTYALRQLGAVSETEAELKLQALRRVRPAFVFRRGSSAASPSAPEFILGELCAEARRFAAPNASGISGSSNRGSDSLHSRPSFLPAHAPAGGSHSRCTLRPSPG